MENLQMLITIYGAAALSAAFMRLILFLDAPRKK